MMKTLKTVTALAFLIFSFSSCDKAEDLLEFDLDFSLDETFNAAASSGIFINSTTINATDDANISDNLDKIKSYEVQKVSIAVSNLVTDTSPSISNLIFTLVHQSGTITLTSAPSISLEALQAQGTIDLPLDQNALEGIRGMLAAGGDIILNAKADIANGPATFDLKISITGKITVGP